jgi:WD40 repeat protein/tRNA A-37 threonylcarbamoyl transferase component Bud32
MHDSTTTPSQCPRCHAPLAADAPEGLCPRCLAALPLGPETVLTGDGRTAAHPPLSVEELAPHFPQLEILQCLGRGGMGVVYKARQKSLNRLVALKLLAPERAGDATFAERFAREAHALAALNHPHIVTVYDFGQAGGFYFLLMEYIDGVNLRQAMNAGRFTPEQALTVVPPVCEALQFAHEHGIVHRDIKPENLLLDRAGGVKIADFGIARMLGDEARPGGVEGKTGEAQAANSQPAGTPQYMAPEQKNQARTDHRADIYSLGVVLYEMLTGELPADKLQAPSRKVQIDVRLDAIVLRALEKSPELRYQTAGEMRTQVETFTHSAAAKDETPGPDDPIIWSPGQPPLVREIVSHFTPVERKEAMLRALLFGCWNAVTFFAFFFSAFFLPSPTGWIIGGCAFLVGLAFYPVFQKMTRDFLCSTAWARQRCVKAEDLRRVRQSQPEARFSRLALWALAWIAVGIAGIPALRALRAGALANPLETVLVLGVLSVAGFAPVGATFFGWLSIVKLRRSSDALRGWGVAVFGATFYPLLAVDVLIYWSLLPGNLFNPMGQLPTTAALQATVFLSAIVDVVTFAWVWQTVRRPAGVAFPAQALSWLAVVTALLALGVIAGVTVLSRGLRHPSSPVEAAQPATVVSAFPRASHFTRNGHSVLVMHDDVQVHYLFYFAGEFSNSNSGSSNVHSLTWMDEGSIVLKNGRTFGYHRESTVPLDLRVNGRDYDLRQGQVFELQEDGSIKHWWQWIPLEAALNPEAVATAIHLNRAQGATSSTLPIFGPAMEQVVPFGAPCQRNCFQFRNGRVFTIGRGPDTTAEQSAEDSKIAEQAGGVDLDALGGDENLQIAGEGCFFSQEHGPDWEKMSAESAVAQLRSATWITGVIELEKKDLPQTYLFKTSRGEMGMMQVAAIVPDGRGFHGDGGQGYGVKLRYKMVPTAIAPGVPDVKPGAMPGAPAAPAPKEAPPRRIAQFRPSIRVGVIACSPDGKFIAVANDGPTMILMQNAPAKVADGWKPTVEILEAASGKSLRVLKLVTAEEESLLAAAQRAPIFEVKSLGFSPDATLLAVGTSIGQVKIFNVQSGELLCAPDDEAGRKADPKADAKFAALARLLGSADALAFSPDGTLLAVGGGAFDDVPLLPDLVERSLRGASGPGRLKIWEVNNFKLLRDLSGHTAHVEAVAFSADGKLLASAGRWSGALGEGWGVKLWHVESGELARTIPTQDNGGPRSVAFSPDGKLVAMGTQRFDNDKKDGEQSSGAVTVTHVNSGIMAWMQTVPGWAKPVGFSADGTRLAVLSGRKAVTFLDAATGAITKTVRAEEAPERGSWEAMAVAPVAKVLAVGGTDKERRGTVEILEF